MEQPQIIMWESEKEPTLAQALVFHIGCILVDGTTQQQKVVARCCQKVWCCCVEVAMQMQKQQESEACSYVCVCVFSKHQQTISPSAVSKWNTRHMSGTRIFKIKDGI